MDLRGGRLAAANDDDAARGLGGAPAGSVRMYNRAAGAGMDVRGRRMDPAERAGARQ